MHAAIRTGLVLILLLAGCGGDAEEPELGAARSEPRDHRGGRAGRLDHRRLPAVGPPRPGAAAVERADPGSQFGYWAQLRLRGTRFRNCGVFGERTDEIASRLDDCAKGAKVLIVQGGINDIAQGRPVAEARRATCAGCVEDGRSRGLRVALAEVLPWNNGYPARRGADQRAQPGDRRGSAAGGACRSTRWYRQLEDPARPGRMKAEWTIDGDHPSVTGYRRLATRCGYRAASSLARANTASIIGSVSLPVNVFCWLGWKQPSSSGPPSAPRARRRGRTSAWAWAPSRQAAPASHAKPPRHTITLRVEQRQLLARRRAGSCRARPGAACWPAARSAPRRPRTRRRGARPSSRRHRLRAGSRSPVRMHRGEQPVARAVAGEHAPGAVGAVRRRRQAEHVDARLGVAEAGRRAAPVLLVGERGALLARHLLAPLDQPRAGAAGLDRPAASLGLQAPAAGEQPLGPEVGGIASAAVTPSASQMLTSLVAEEPVPHGLHEVEERVEVRQLLPRARAADRPSRRCRRGTPAAGSRCWR